MNFRQLLEERKLIVGDGAMGSQLIDRGLPADVPGELWNIEKPEVIASIQHAYAEAGADYLLTNTFGANPISLARHDLDDRLEIINRAAVQIAREATAGSTAAVIGDMGPTGRLLAPLGDLTEQEAREAYALQTRALASAGVDAIIAETFESAEEVTLALTAAREECDLPLLMSMKLAPTRDGNYHSVMGEGPEALVAAAEHCGCDVVGTNCGHGIASMVGLVRVIASLTDMPVIAQPNAGQPELVEGQTVYRETARTFAEHIEELHEVGARIIGGCCGTTPEHVQAIRRFAGEGSC